MKRVVAACTILILIAITCTRRESWLSSPSRHAYHKKDRIGPRNTRKDTKNFGSKIDGYLCITFLVDFLCVVRVFRGLKECEAKNCSGGLEVTLTWARISCRHDLRSLAGPSDSFSDEVADQRRRRRSQNDSFREWRFGNLDGTIAVGASTGSR